MIEIPQMAPFAALADVSGAMGRHLKLLPKSVSHRFYSRERPDSLSQVTVSVAASAYWRHL
jgi:hypothetical protein